MEVDENLIQRPVFQIYDKTLNLDRCSFTFQKEEIGQPLGR